jgi:hypothetical protein
MAGERGLSGNSFQAIFPYVHAAEYGPLSPARQRVGHPTLNSLARAFTGAGFFSS